MAMRAAAVLNGAIRYLPSSCCLLSRTTRFTGREVRAVLCETACMCLNNYYGTFTASIRTATSPNLLSGFDDSSCFYISIL
jgi:hypothetical protein